MSIWEDRPLFDETPGARTDAGTGREFATAHYVAMWCIAFIIGCAAFGGVLAVAK